MPTATEQALQPETFADMPTDSVPTDPGWFSQLLKGTLGAFYSPKFYSGEPWVDESAYILPTSSQVGEGIFARESADTAKNRAMMMGLNTENYDQHMRYAGALEDKVNTGEMTLGEYHVESAKNLAQIQKDQGGLQATINALTGGALMGAQGALWQYKTEAQKSDQPDYVGDWGDVASRDLAGNIQGISEVYGQPYRDIVDRTKAWFQPSTESGVIDTSVPLTDMINNRGIVQDDFRASYDTQQTPVSQALQGVFPQGAPTSLMEEAQPPRSLPIGTPGWQPDISAQTISPDWNLRDRMSQMYERAFIDPDEYGWTRPTIEQRQEAIRGVRDAPKGFWGALQSRIADLIPGAEASVARDVEFEREQREPTWFPPTTSSGSAMVTEPIPTVEPSPFIDPSFAEGGYTIAPSGPAVGDEEEEVSEERVVEIKKKPREERTSVEEQVVVASAVKKALSNASKGKKVKNELKAIVELAKVDPTIVKRYTTPGSQELQDITAQVDSFAWMPKKKKAVPGYGKPPTRPGGR